LHRPKELLALTAGSRWHALYAVALATGLRQGELLGLRWEDVDLAAGLVHVRKQAQRVKGKGIVLADLKTDSSQASVPLARFAAFALVAHRERQQEERELAGKQWQEHGLVFPSSVGTPQGAPNVLRRWWRDCDALEIERRPFHDLRHTTATLLFARDVPMATIQRILRHARLSTTADIYTEIFDEALAVAAGAIDSAFAKMDDADRDGEGAPHGNRRIVASPSP
jgi:integrase